MPVVAGVKALENKQVITSGTRRISNFIFETYYNEVCGHLQSDIRKWLESIHANINEVNKLSDRLNTLVWDVAGKPSMDDLDMAKVIVHDLYRDIHMLDWEIEFFPNDSNDKNLDMYSTYHEEHWNEREELAERLSTLSSEPKILI